MDVEDERKESVRRVARGKVVFEMFNFTLQRAKTHGLRARVEYLVKLRLTGHRPGVHESAGNLQPQNLI